MDPDPHDAALLLDMMTHARGVVQAVAGRSLAAYAADENLRRAVERRLEIIGEAAGRVSSALRAAHPDIPWRKIVAQRNILIHEYGDVDDEIVWGVATISVPELLRLLEPLVPPVGDEGDA